MVFIAVEKFGSRGEGVSQDNSNQAVLVVGAGITGIETALELAQSGCQVYLLERAPNIGGTIAQLDRLFPKDELAVQYLAKKIEALSTYPNIKLITHANLEKVSGQAGDFEVSIKREPLRITEECDKCGRCILVCPIKPYDPFNEGLTLRTAIDLQNPACALGQYNILRETPVCQQSCPVGIDIRGYVGLIADGRYLEAIDLVKKRNPLPAICGRVCNHPCESQCNRGKEDEPIAIDTLKRFVADYELRLRREGKIPRPKPVPKNGLGKVAIVGAGPAGLTCAHDLAKKGYESVIFEAAPVPGGMLYLGIPEYRLPRDIILEEVEAITDLGVELRLKTPINKELTIDDLLTQGYKAIFLAIGAHKGLKLGVPGEDEYEGFLDCIVFLRRVNLGDKTKPGKRVIVIGGGNSAIDAARTALRVGSDEVYILYRRSRKEMPANPWEIEEAEHEGVKIHYLAAPVKITGEKGKVTGMECIRMELGKPDASGRRRPVPIKGSEFFIEADVIVPAISQEPDLSFLHEGHGLSINRWNSFDVDSRTMQTNRPGIYAGGDAVTGPATVIEAIAAGHKAADSIDKYLRSS
jgi:heterodisulfide reductase subunit A